MKASRCSFLEGMEGGGEGERKEGNRERTEKGTATRYLFVALVASVTSILMVAELLIGDSKYLPPPSDPLCDRSCTF